MIKNLLARINLQRKNFFGKSRSTYDIARNSLQELKDLDQAARANLIYERYISDKEYYTTLIKSPAEVIADQKLENLKKLKLELENSEESKSENPNPNPEENSKEKKSKSENPNPNPEENSKEKRIKIRESKSKSRRIKSRETRSRRIKTRSAG